MNLFSFFNLVTYLPIIDIPMYPGGPLAVRGASYKGLCFLCVLIITVFVVVVYMLASWYLRHPILGNIALVAAGYWLLRQVVHFFLSLWDDPLTRTTPYRRD